MYGHFRKLPKPPDFLTLIPSTVVLLQFPVERPLNFAPSTTVTAMDFYVYDLFLPAVRMLFTTTSFNTSVLSSKKEIFSCISIYSNRLFYCFVSDKKPLQDTFRFEVILFCITHYHLHYLQPDFFVYTEAPTTGSFVFYLRFDQKEKTCAQDIIGNNIFP